MNAETEKQALVAFGSIILVGGLTFAIWGANIVSTAASCASSFWCNLGSSINGSDLNRYYVLGELLEMIGVVLGILGSASVGYGFVHKPRVAETGQSVIPANPRWSTQKMNSERLQQFCTNCGSDRISGAAFCGSCGTKLSQKV